MCLGVDAGIDTDTSRVHKVIIPRVDTGAFALKYICMLKDHDLIICCNFDYV